MKNLELIVTDDGRIEMTVDGAEPFLLVKAGSDSGIDKLTTILGVAGSVWVYGGTCRISMGEVDEAA